MPNGYDKNWIRFCAAVDGFFERHGHWPTIVQTSPICIENLRQILSDESLRVVTKKVKLVPGEELFVAEDDQGNNYSYDLEGFPDSQPDPCADERFGLPMRNRETLSSADAVNRGLIAVSREALDRLGPPSPIRVDWDRIEGMLLGLAIGDALGNTTESRLPSSRFQQYGELRDYIPNRNADNRRVGLPSDDTQLAFWTLECLCADHRLLPEHLAKAFSGRRIYQIGSTLLAFLRGYKDEGKLWWEAAQPSAGNGAVMRIAPVLLPHLRHPSPALWDDAAVAGAITHNDPSSIGACVGLVGILWELLDMDRPPEPDWWIDTYCARARPVEGIVELSPRHENFSFAGPVWKLVDTEVRRALRENIPDVDACNYWHSGAYLLETMPSVMLILARHGHDPEEAIVRAVNDTKDNDTVAAIVGAAVGALHGRRALPRRWIDGLLGRTTESDDGRVFELIEMARKKWSDP